MATARKSAKKAGVKKVSAKRPVAKKQSNRRVPTADGVVDERRTAAAMSQSERDAIQAWFASTRDALGRLSTSLAAQIKTTPTGDRKDDLMKVKGQLLDAQQMLDRQEEAFFAEGSSETMRPPTEEEIKRTRELAEAFGEAIADQKAAEAIAKLASDLADIASKISAPG